LSEAEERARRDGKEPIAPWGFSGAMTTPIKKYYWWECVGDNAHWLTTEALLGKSFVQFLKDLAASAWRDQASLVQRCPTCRSDMRVTYYFARKTDPETVRVFHIVGLPKPHADTLQMMWETEIDGWGEKGTRLFDFKYIYKSGWQGLTKPAVFERHELVALFTHYKDITGTDPPCPSAI
jgi:hypothetical protein